MILIDSFYRKDENYYPKVFFGKYYFTEDKEFFVVILMKNVIINNVWIYF